MIDQLVAVLLLTATPAPATPALPLGDAGLPETRTVTTVAPGVTRTSIVRGTDPAPPGEINTTTEGPWRIQVLTIDPRRARGQLRVVLDRRGCVVRTAAVRGTVLTAGQLALQATGSQEAVLVGVATGCVRITSELRDADGDRVAVRPGVYAVNGRYRLTENGAVVVPPGSGSFFDRNPRTIAGTTRTGEIVLATIDGRRTTSVGTTMDETAAVAHVLGLRDAINLDGGGSTTMSVRGTLVNQPSGGSQRPVGDALIWTN
ncbi:phosphodiester glycosidase family protein [Paractinoplanes durhamensis]|uniref:Phosphodiester glycosidase domain-containing protein n=1 Tax=Paractinoplanes durhamensis TaxID=113563 RepID=A0ABQ3Z3H4_9ACTN|nr:phosphodiester glycosidase family protein [Actinoplanes durhamensis]GIE04366.1 hypothetical protein Adu01nite_57160 [Actinoplanes durhamensis]